MIFFHFILCFIFVLVLDLVVGVCDLIGCAFISLI